MDTAPAEKGMQAGVRPRRSLMFRRRGFARGRLHVPVMGSRRRFLVGRSGQRRGDPVSPGPRRSLRPGGTVWATPWRSDTPVGAAPWRSDTPVGSVEFDGTGVVNGLGGLVHRLGHTLRWRAVTLRRTLPVNPVAEAFTPPVHSTIVKYAALAQSAERLTRNEKVIGSIPIGGSTRRNGADPR